jgi:ADP-ribosylglycohydrolase
MSTPARRTHSAPAAEARRTPGPVILGAVVGDVVGSVFEGSGWKSKQFPLLSPACTFTDDTVLTVATAEALLTGAPYARVYLDYGREYPDAGYGEAFRQWLVSKNPAPYGSFGNGSAMRVSPIGWAATSLEWALAEAQRSAAVTHDHPDGIKGAQAVASAVFLARTGSSRIEIRKYLERTFGYQLRRTLDAIRPAYVPNVTCQGSVPEAIIAFLEAEDFKDALRNAVSLGGDADTQASIAGAIAQAFGDAIPGDLEHAVRTLLPKRFLEVMEAFAKSYLDR